MKPLIKISLRKIKKDKTRNMLIVSSLFFSSFIITVFASLALLSLKNKFIPSILSSEFSAKLSLYISISAFLVLAITLLNIIIHSSMKGEENLHTLAVLSSVGAKVFQKIKLILFDVCILYFPPIFAGNLIGAFILSIILFEYKNITFYFLISLILSLGEFILIIICNFASSLKLLYRPVISGVKEQNEEAFATRHGYRESRTFKQKPILFRLAKKSVEYRKKPYSLISLTLASSALYPIMGMIVLSYIGNLEVILDTNPYDNFDASAQIIQSVAGILTFTLICFLFLSVIGFSMAALMIKTQIAARKKYSYLYLSVGIPEEDIKKLFLYEVLNMLYCSFAYILFGGLILSFVYSLVSS